MKRTLTGFAALVLALAVFPASLWAQRGGMGHGGRGGVAVRGSGHVSGNPRGAVVAPRGFRHDCFGCFGHRRSGHRGVNVGVGVQVRTRHFGVGLGFDSFHQRAVRPRFGGAFIPFGYAYPYPYYVPYGPYVPYLPLYPSTTVVVVPGYGPYVSNGYYVDPPPQNVQASQEDSRYVVASGSAGPVQRGPRLILLAFQDHSIYAATDYWVEGDTLFYTTSYGARNQATVSALDLDLTTQLNRERGIEFSLEARTVR